MSENAQKSPISTELPWETNSPCDADMRKLTINIYGRLPAICEGVAYCLKRDLNVDAKFLDGNPESHPDDADLIIIQDRLKNPSCKTIDPRPGASTKFIALYEENYLSAHFLISQGFNCGLPVSRPLHELVRVIKKSVERRKLILGWLHLVSN